MSRLSYLFISRRIMRKFGVGCQKYFINSFLGHLVCDCNFFGTCLTDFWNTLNFIEMKFLKNIKTPTLIKNYKKIILNWILRIIFATFYINETKQRKETHEWQTHVRKSILLPLFMVTWSLEGAKRWKADLPFQLSRDPMLL